MSTSFTPAPALDEGRTFARAALDAGADPWAEVPSVVLDHEWAPGELQQWLAGVAVELLVADGVRPPAEVARADALRARFVQGVNHVARAREIGEDASPTAFTIARGIGDVDERLDFLAGVLAGLDDAAAEDGDR